MTLTEEASARPIPISLRTVLLSFHANYLSLWGHFARVCLQEILRSGMKLRSSTSDRQSFR